MVEIEVVESSPDPVTALQARRFVEAVMEGQDPKRALAEQGLTSQDLNMVGSEFRSEVLRLISKAELDDETRARLLRAALNVILMKGLAENATERQVSQSLQAAKIMSEDQRLQYRGYRNEAPQIDIRVIAPLISKLEQQEDEQK